MSVWVLIKEETVEEIELCIQLPSKILLFNKLSYIIKYTNMGETNRLIYVKKCD